MFEVFKTNYAKKIAAVRICLGGLKILVSKMLVFMRFLEVLEGLERSRRLVGKSPPIFIEIRLHGTELLPKNRKANDKRSNHH